MRHKILFSLLALFLVTAQASEEKKVYKRVEKDGSVTYSTEPVPGGEAVELKPLSVVKGRPAAMQHKARVELDQKKAAEGKKEYKVKITHPEHDTSMWGSAVDVGVSVEPSFPDGAELVAILDGEEAGRSTTGKVTIENLVRGTHRLKVVLKSEAGVELASSKEIVFYSHQKSLLNPTNNNLNMP